MAARKDWEVSQPKSEQASKNIPSGELHCQVQIHSVRLLSTSVTVSWGSSLPLARASFMEVCKAKLSSAARGFLEDVHLPWTAWAAPGPRGQLRRRNCRNPREQRCPLHHTLQQCQEQPSSPPRQKGHNARGVRLIHLPDSPPFRAFSGHVEWWLLGLVQFWLGREFTGEHFSHSSFYLFLAILTNLTDCRMFLLTLARVRVHETAKRESA